MEVDSPFQKLKPVCIELSRAVLAFSRHRASAGEVVAAQQNLRKVLSNLGQKSPDVLNKNLADYVFFPLSHVLRQHQTLPQLAVESCLGCVVVLLRSAWRPNVEPKLGVQLLILLTVLADPDSQSGAAQQRSEELQCVLFDCFCEVFTSTAATQQGRQELLKADHIPYLGKSVYEIIQGVIHGPSQDVQLSALMALQSFIQAIDDVAALSKSFFPGIVSALQKVLSPPSAPTSPRFYKILVKSLDMLGSLLTLVLNDDIIEAHQANSALKSSEQSSWTYEQGWLETTVEKTSTVLLSVTKLRSHERADVHRALEAFCVRIIRKSKRTFENMLPAMVETLIAIAAKDGEQNNHGLGLEELRINKSLSSIVEDHLHSWILSLPRIMQLNDDFKKRAVTSCIAVSYDILSSQGMDLSTIDNLLAVNLRDGAAALCVVKKPELDQITFAPHLSSLDLRSVSSVASHDFWPLSVFSESSTLPGLIDLEQLAKQLAASSNCKAVLDRLVDDVVAETGLQQISSFWTTLQILKARLTTDNGIDTFLDLDVSEEYHSITEALEDLYEASLGILKDAFAERTTWQVRALALQCVALQANTSGRDFRVELIEILLPVLEAIGDPSEKVQNAAISCLNTIASSCKYDDVADVIISNVDYLVNAVAFKMNSFEISAQAPTVLIMMVRLTGPRLLVFLDDTVESMFAALEAYHGYTKLNESIFQALMAIVHEGAKLDHLNITGIDTGKYRGRARSPMDLNSLVEIVKAQRIKDFANDEVIELEADGPNELGQKQRASTPRDRSEVSRPSEVGKHDIIPHADRPVTASEPPSLPKTYSILVKIAELTQHFLGASSPAFRGYLLSLLNEVFPTLARHEDSFLPVLNTLWPVVVSRLDDIELFVIAAALDTVQCMCRWAGDFMRSRISTLWPELLAIARDKAAMSSLAAFASSRRNTKKKAVVSASNSLIKGKPRNANSTSVGTYVDVPTRSVREALVKLVLVIVEHVDIDEDMFDDALELLASRLGDAEVRRIMERRNADAVWLVLSRQSGT